MEGEYVEDSDILDVLDKQIVHALTADARISFARLGAILDISEQTAARRYRSLRRRGMIHVSGQVNSVPLGHTKWLLRIRSTPSRAPVLAETLARVPDLSWVSLLSTGYEVFCTGRPRSAERRDELLLRLIPRVSDVLELSVQEVMRQFSLADEWPRYGRMLTTEQLRELGPRPSLWEPSGPEAPVTLSREDGIMLTILGHDGRAPYAQISAATGWSATRVARRMSELVESGVLYFDLDFAMEAMGYSARALLWLRVRPGDLEKVGLTVATYSEVAFLAAISGSANLFASVACRDTAHLYRFVTERLGSLEGVGDVEVTPALRTYKQSQTLLDSRRPAVKPSQ
ncbi:MAG: hypothetical protein JWN03_7232 [Nocardia sp.]|uniref:Lrp/AsnC family transcriptional regulator n=1 Tax=Nocardia sp. TaxID=1821 RepID=UPI0026078D4C|nr:AsnC family transcriptional regulator [Nocardia sp.]MCU1646957.1 hypothetical protein [Nocardia sp.]